jgi:hypothetical protein
MDLSGRFDFWRVLLHTRAITPPPRVVALWARLWWTVPVAAVLAAGLLTELSSDKSQPQAAAVETPANATPTSQSPPRQSW